MYEEDDEFDIQPESKELTVVDFVCCDIKMSKQIQNSSLIYICFKCGRLINSIEYTEQKVEEGEFKNIAYGSKSETYIQKIRQSMNEKLTEINLEIDSETKNKIIEDFLILRNERIPRATPRKGLIGACIHFNTGYLESDIIKKLEIEQRFLTLGIKLYLTYLKPFRGFNISENIINNLRQLKLTEEETLIIKKLILVCIGFYIGLDTTIKTKCVGAYWYLMQNKMDISEAEKILGTKKNTIYKFYDQIVIYLNAKGLVNSEVNESFHNRRTELQRFMIDHKLPIMEIIKKGRYTKFYDIFKF